MSKRDKQIVALKTLFKEEVQKTIDVIRESSDKSAKANKKIANGTAHHIFVAIKRKVTQ